MVWHRCAYKDLGKAAQLCSFVEVDAMLVQVPGHTGGVWLAAHPTDLMKVGCHRMLNGLFGTTGTLDQLLVSSDDETSVVLLDHYVATCADLGIHPLIELKTLDDVSILATSLPILQENLVSWFTSRNGAATLFTSDVRLLPTLGGLPKNPYLGIGVDLRQAITPMFQEWLFDVATYQFVIVAMWNIATDVVRPFKATGAHIVPHMVNSEEDLRRALLFIDEGDGQNGIGEVMFMVEDATQWQS